MDQVKLLDAINEARKVGMPSHELHIWVAWTILINLEFPEALEFACQFYRKNQSPSAKIGYHATITQAYMRLIYSSLKKFPDANFEEFRIHNEKLFVRNMAALKTHYTEARLWSKEAKENFVEGDLISLPTL